MIEITEVDYDGELNYAVRLSGAAADLYDDEEFERDVDAYEFARQVSRETGIEITWGCTPFAWID